MASSAAKGLGQGMKSIESSTASAAHFIGSSGSVAMSKVASELPFIHKSKEEKKSEKNEKNGEAKKGAVLETNLDDEEPAAAASKPAGLTRQVLLTK